MQVSRSCVIKSDPSHFVSEHISWAFLVACQHGTHPSYRARINIIGHSGAGKTSLTRRLLGQNFQKNENSTDGIETHRIEFDLHESSHGCSLWSKEELKTSQLVKTFNDEVYRLVKNCTSTLSQQSGKRVEALKWGDKNKNIVNELQNYAKEKQSEKENKVQLQQSGKKADKSDTQNNIGANNTQLTGKIDNLSRKPNMSLKKSGVHGTADNVTNDMDKGVLQLWDFGGQTEFYTTHHMFLDADAVNIIVMDISKPLKRKLTNQHAEDKQLVGNPVTPEDFLCYWLRTIQVKAVGKEIQPTVLLVLTHIDEIAVAEQETYIDSFKVDVKNIIQKKQLPCIHDKNMFVVDNKNGPAADFAQLRKCVQIVTTREANWGSLRPIRWLKLEAEMKQMIDKRRNVPLTHVSFNDVKDLSKIYHMDKEELEACLLFLHRVGDLIWFPDKGLRDVITVNPQWLVDTFQVLVTSEQFIRRRHLQDAAFLLIKHGIVSFRSLERFWAGNDVRFLVEIMMKFDLILPVESESHRLFVVPSLLPVKQVSPERIACLKFCKAVYSTQYIAEFEELFPIGTFPKILAAACKIWPIYEDIELSHNFASLQLSGEMIMQLYQPHRSTIEATIWCNPDKLERHPLGQVLEATTALATILQAQGIPQSDICCVVCPNWRPEYALFCTTKALQKSLGPDSGFDGIQYLHSTCLCPTH